MKIYDISQELFSSRVYPGDPVPVREQVLSLEKGDSCNLSTVFLCAHNGTHVDAPLHFCPGGKTVEQMDLSRTVGKAYVYEGKGEITEEDGKRLAALGAKRVLFKGEILLTPESARILNGIGVLLVGVESQTVGNEEVHRELLEKEVALLEGIRLDEVPEGAYLLSAAPLNLGGSDGAPCRAILIEGE